MDIIWKDIPAYADWYEVNNLGEVRRKAFEIGLNNPRSWKGYQKRHYKAAPVNPLRTSRGYQVVLRSNNHKFRHMVDHLVLSAFKGPAARSDPHHIDGDIYNNQLNNLEWVERDPWEAQGLLEPKKIQYKKILTQAEVEKAFTDTRSNTEVGREIGISPLAVELIKRRIIWTKYTDKLTRQKRNAFTVTHFGKYTTAEPDE